MSSTQSATSTVPAATDRTPAEALAAATPTSAHCRIVCAEVSRIVLAEEVIRAAASASAEVNPPTSASKVRLSPSMDSIRERRAIRSASFSALSAETARSPSRKTRIACAIAPTSSRRSTYGIDVSNAPPASPCITRVIADNGCTIVRTRLAARIAPIAMAAMVAQRSNFPRCMHRR